MSGGEKRFLGEVLPIAKAFRDLIAPACQQIEIVGSIRRQAERVGDIEVAAIPLQFDGKNALNWLLDEYVQEKVIEQAVIVDKNGKSGHRWGLKHRIATYQGMKVDIFQCDPHSWIPHGLVIRTGSAEAMHYLMQQMIYRNAPFRFQEGALVFRDEKLLLPHEGEFWGLMGMPFLPPMKRTLEEFRDWFTKHWGGWGHPERFVPVARQMTLGGAFNALMNEIYTKRDDDEAKAGVAKQVVLPPYTFQPPWKEGGMVWIRNGYHDGQPHFIQVDEFSPAGEKQREHLARQLHSGFYTGETNTLLKFLLDGKWLTFHDFVDIPPYLLDPYIDRDRAVKRTVNPCDILPTQKEVDAWVTRQYFCRVFNQRNDENKLPLGVQFRNNDRVYMTDGHHRLMAARQYGRSVFEIEVQRLPVTLDELLYGLPPQEVDYAFLADVMEEALQILQEGNLCPA